MKLIAAKHFANVKSLGLKLDPAHKLFQHEAHVPKGYRFSVGDAEAFDGLTEAEKVIVRQLVHSRSVIFDTKENAAKVADLEKEVAAEIAFAKKQEKAESVGLQDLIASAVTAALGAAPAKA